MVSVTIGGYTPDSVVDITDSSARGDELGAATITMAATTANKDTIEAGQDVTISRSSGTWTGYVAGERQPDSPELMAVRAIETRLELKHEQLHQVFYDVARSEAVKLAVTKRAQSLAKSEIHTGDDLTDWTSNAPEFQLYEGARAGLYEWGTDLLALGARAGHSGTLTATYANVTTTAIEDGIFELDTRLLVNDRGGLWSTEIELVTPGGTTYVWTPSLETSGFVDLALPAEEATTDGELTDRTGVLQYRFTPAATLANNTAILIDNAHTIPFRRRDRATAIGVGGVQDTGDSIIRRVDKGAASFVDDLAVEAGYEWWTDESDVLHFEESGRSQQYDITQGSTPVVDVEVDRDYESIRNIVTVQGAGDVEVTVRDQGSIAFYGPNARTEPVVDETIQSEDEARARAEGYLENEAWDDATVTFSVADASYNDLLPNDRIPVEWSRQGLSGTYTVSGVRMTSSSIVDVTIIASSGA